MPQFPLHTQPSAMSALGQLMLLSQDICTMTGPFTLVHGPVKTSLQLSYLVPSIPILVKIAGGTLLNAAYAWQRRSNG